MTESAAAIPALPAVPAGDTRVTLSGRRGPRSMTGHLQLAADHRVAFEIHRTAHGRLRDAYPCGAHDITVQVLAPSRPSDITDAIAVLGPLLLDLDPACRRVIFAAPADEVDLVRAAEAAGYRFVVDVDIAGDITVDGGTPHVDSISLLVLEPSRVVQVSGDVEQMPTIV